MTRDEILNMEAGEEIDKLVAEKVMDWHIAEDGFGKNWNDSENHYQCRASNYQSFEDEEDFNLIFWHPSGSLLWAWRVVEKLSLHIGATNGNWYVSNVHDLNQSNAICVIADAAPLAICRAALLAVMESE